ncbi:reticulon-like protein B3 [Phalaenopsis equestris]|uniref:reticulon-like protein B3 n=1 Tax=Phalaenopsis equestris TaxID=78828 RepID=UPI0009E599B8|nr:reticulon-like protein B3 [Phalaenopsis equestris]
MAEQVEESIPRAEPRSFAEKIHRNDSSSSSSDSGNDKSGNSSSVKTGFRRVFGRKKPVHQVLGGGKPADVFLWRNKKISAGSLAVATAIWILFELLDYHLLTLVSYGLILLLAILFLWSNATSFISKSPPSIPEISIPEDLTVNVALSLRYEINKIFAFLWDAVAGRDLKKFLAVIAGLWALSAVGSSCSFLTLFYIAFVLLLTVPVLYEKYDDKVDFYWEKATAELEKHYNFIHEKVASKIPKAAQTKDKKHQ